MGYDFKKADNKKIIFVAVTVVSVVVTILNSLSFVVPTAAILFSYALLCVNIVKEWNRRPVLFLGKYSRTAGPGFTFIDFLFHTVMADIPIQDVVISVPVESAQTKDNVGIGFKGILTYRIVDVQKAVVEVQDIFISIAQRAVSTLADETGKTDLEGLLEHRDTFSENIKKTLNGRIEPWGGKVVAFELKDFRIADESVAQAIAMKAKAKKEGEAELERANIQLQVTEKLKEAAAAMTDEAWRYKAMEVLIEMTRSAQNNTILIPSDVVDTLGKCFNRQIGIGTTKG